MDGPSTSQHDGSTAEAPWALLGRDTAAGRALFSLYSSDNIHGRATGLHYSQRNRQQIQRQLTAKAEAGAAAGPKPEEHAKKSKPHVAVPRFKGRGGATSPTGGVNKLAHLPHRRQGQQILAGMAAEAEKAWGQVPMPSGRLIDAQEKERCALLMQHRGNIPGVSQLTAAGKARAAAAAGRQHQPNQQQHVDDSLISRRRALQQRFHEVADEVAEREEFVGSMQSLAKLQAEHLHAVRGEVAAKVQEMGQLDGHIKELDKQLLTEL